MNPFKKLWRFITGESRGYVVRHSGATRGGFSSRGDAEAWARDQERLGFIAPGHWGVMTEQEWEAEKERDREIAP